MLYERLKTDSLTARRDRDAKAAALLGLVIAGTEKNAQSGKTRRDPTDDDAVRALEEVEASVVSNLGLESISAEQRQAFEAEHKLLNAYLPPRLEGDDLKIQVEAFLAREGLPTEVRHTGAVVNAIKSVSFVRVRPGDVSAILKAGA